jgi:WD40 repeat protein
MRLVRMGTGWVRELAFTPDGRTLTAVVSDGVAFKVVLGWDPVRDVVRQIARLREIRSALSRTTARLAAVEWAPRTHETPLTLRELGGPDQSPRPRLPLHSADRLAFAPDGRTLLVGRHLFVPTGAVTELTGWDAATGRLLATRRVRVLVDELALSPDGRLLAVGDFQRAVLLYGWPARRGRARRRLRSIIRRLAFAPDGRTLAVAAGWSVHLFGGKALAPRGRLMGHRDSVTDLAFAPGGDTLVSVGSDGAVNVWDPAAGRRLRSHAWGVGPLGAVALAPDGLTAAAGGAEGRVVVWDLDEG